MYPMNFIIHLIYMENYIIDIQMNINKIIDDS